MANNAMVKYFYNHAKKSDFTLYASLNAILKNICFHAYNSRFKKKYILL